MSRIERAMERAAQLRQGVIPPAEVPIEEAPQLHQDTGLSSEMPIDQLPRLNVETTPPAELHGKESKRHIHIPPAIDAYSAPFTSSNPFLVNPKDPYSPIAEEYRKLKAALVRKTEGDGFFKNTLMVTSAEPNEGKSLTALNLAISMAQEYDHTVLLIDADFRRPSINRYMDIDMKIGFAECLLGEAEIGDVIRPGGIGRLSVITAGREVTNPVELFASQKTELLITEIKNRYPDRFIIFDTPPVLPFAESRTLAHLVDGVLFVIKEQLASQKNIKEALDTLKGAEILGIVYNDTKGEHNKENYYRYERYSRSEA